MRVQRVVGVSQVLADHRCGDAGSGDPLARIAVSEIMGELSMGKYELGLLRSQSIEACVAPKRGQAGLAALLVEQLPQSRDWIGVVGDGFVVGRLGCLGRR